MSKLVDERVVEMSFDNSNFDKNVKTSISSIDKLKNALNFSGMANAMNKSLGSVDTSVLATGLNTVAGRFSALEIAGITAISNITNRVIDLGIQMVKSLSVDNIIAGWQKYADKTTSVATLIAQGYDMEEVNAQLEKLNFFTDETSYTFTDMVSNISKFTAAGQKLDDSVEAMMGIANWAALSGQNAATASRAMYQLSQAMGAGVVQLMDYKSIQNANMDTDEFRQKVLDAAVAMGKLNKTITGEYITEAGHAFTKSQFTEFLSSDKWFSSDILMKVLNEYSSAVDQIYEAVSNGDFATASEAIEAMGDELDAFGLKAFRAAQEARTFEDTISSVKEAVASTWMATAENIFGGYDEAKVLWTDLANELYDVFAEPRNQVNEILSAWGELGGRNDIFAHTEEETGAFWNLYDAILNVVNLIKTAWADVFPIFKIVDEEGEALPEVIDNLKAFTERVKEWSESLEMSEETAEKLSNILKGLFSILKFIGKTIGAIWEGLLPLRELVLELASKAFTILSNAGKKFSDFVDETTLFTTISEKLSGFLRTIIEAIKDFDIIGKIRTIIAGIYNVVSRIINVIKGSGIIEKVITQLAKVVSFLKQTFYWFMELDIIQLIIQKFKTMFEIFKANGGTSENFTRIINGIKAAIEILSRALVHFYNFFINTLWPATKKVLDFIGPYIPKIAGYVVKVLAWIGDLIVKLNNFLKTNDRFQNGIRKIGSVLKEVVSQIAKVFSSFGNISTDGLDEFEEKTERKLRPVEVFFLGLRDLFSGLWSLVQAITPVLGYLFSYIGKVLTMIGNKFKSVFSGNDSLFKISDLFSAAFWTTALSYLIWMGSQFVKWAQAFKNIILGVGDVLDSKAMLQYAEALKNFALSILILVAALVLLAAIDADEITRAMAVLEVLLTTMLIFLKAFKKMFTSTGVNFKMSIKGIIEQFSSALSIMQAAKAIMTFTISIAILVGALYVLSKMDMESITNGLFAITILMAELVIVTKILSKTGTGVGKASRGLLGLSIAVLILATAVKKIAQLDADSLKRGLFGVAVLVALCTLFVVVEKRLKGAFRAGMSLLLLAGVLLLMTVPMKQLAKIGWDGLAKGIIGMTAFVGMLYGLTFVLKNMPKLSITSAMSLVVLSSALVLMVIPFMAISRLSWSGLLKGIIGLTAFVGVLFGLTIVLKSMPKLSIAKAFSIVLIGTALMAFAISLRLLARMQWGGILKAIASLAVVIVGMYAITKIFTAKGYMSILTFSVALTALSASLVIFAVAVAALNSIRPEALFKALTVFAVGLIALAVAAKIFKPAVLTILELSVAFVLFAAAIAVIVASISLLVTVIGTFGVSIIDTIVSVCESITAALPAVFDFMIAFVQNIIQALRELLPSIFVLITEVVDSILNLLIAEGPKLIDTVLLIIVELLDALAQNMPSIMSSLMSIVISILEALRENIYKIIDIVIGIVLNLLDAIIDRTPEMIDKLGNLVITVVEAIVAKIIELVPRLINAGVDLILGLLEGIGQAIEDNAERVRGTMISFYKHIWNAFVNFFGINSPSTLFAEGGKYIMQGLLQGLKNAWISVKNWFSDAWKWISEKFNALLEWIANAWENIKNGVSNIFESIGEGVSNAWNSAAEGISEGLNAAWNWVSDTATEAVEWGSNLMEGVADGIVTGATAVGEAVTDAANWIGDKFKSIFGINSPSKVFMEYGKYLMDGLGIGIEDNTNEPVDALSECINAISNALQTEYDDTITITPVLDLTEIQNGTDKLDKMIGKSREFSVSNSYDMAQATANKMTTRNTTPSSTPQVEKTVTNDSVINNNTFNITSDNPREVADEVSRILQKQIDRRHAKWAT